MFKITTKNKLNRKVVRDKYLQYHFLYNRPSYGSFCLLVPDLQAGYDRLHDENWPRPFSNFNRLSNNDVGCFKIAYQLNKVLSNQKLTNIGLTFLIFPQEVAFKNNCNAIK